jgi:hypothetical protein
MTEQEKKDKEKLVEISSILKNFFDSYPQKEQTKNDTKKKTKK